VCVGRGEWTTEKGRKNVQLTKSALASDFIYLFHGFFLQLDDYPWLPLVLYIGHYKNLQIKGILKDIVGLIPIPVGALMYWVHFI